MKKLITLMVLLCFISLSTSSFGELSQDSNIKVIINNDEVNFDVKPAIKNSRVQVPFRKVFETLGAVVSWDDKTKTVKAVKDDIIIELTLGSKNAVVNNSPRVLDSVVFIDCGRVFVPIRFVSESLGCKVDWQSTIKTVFISTYNTNQVVNSGFEYSTANGEPVSWVIDKFDTSSDASMVKVVSGVAHSGSKCLMIDSKKHNDVKVTQNIKVKQGKIYKLSCWVKLLNEDQEYGRGPKITVFMSNGIFESTEINESGQGWQLIECYLKMLDGKENSLSYSLRFGGFGMTATGIVYFDDASIEMVDSVPQGAKVQEFFVVKPADSHIEKMVPSVK